MKKKVAIDVSPLYSDDRFRGVGFYTKRLTEVLADFKKDLSFEIELVKDKERFSEERFDLVHYPYFSPFFKTLPGKSLSPFIVTVHDLIPLAHPKHFPAGLRGRLGWFGQKSRLKKASAILTDSLFWKKEIARLVGFKKEDVYSIMLAAGEKYRLVSDKKELSRVKRKYHLPEKFVLYVGDINWNKNVPGIIKACEQVGASLVMVGKKVISGSFNRNHPENRDLVWVQNQIERTKNEKSGFRILPLGFVPDEDLVLLYNLATVFCFPSFDEGFGLPVLEAFACGCPVITSNSGSLPEVAGEAALKVNPNEVDSITQALLKLLGNLKERQKWSRKGLIRAGKFSWRETARQTIIVYQKFLNEKSN